MVFRVTSIMFNVEIGTGNAGYNLLVREEKAAVVVKLTFEVYHNISSFYVNYFVSYVLTLYLRQFK